jgi:hypothetical protein
MTSIADSDIFEKLRSQIEQFLLLLSEKERFVVMRRFNLDEKTRSTLEEIGHHFHITRERVRQIEKNALQKLRRNIENNSLQTINNLAFEHLQAAGGVMREDFLISKILKDASGFTMSAISLVVCLDKRFDRLPNSILLFPYVKFKTISAETIENIFKKSLAILEKKQNIMSLQEIETDLKKTDLPTEFYQNGFLRSLFQIHKSFKVNDDNVGLLQWRHINPRTLRDKILFILKKSGQPLHFVDICNNIIKENFDRKNINLQAVHNELIRYSEFILIGRGIYALKEWGYKAGTVAHVIESILKKKQSLDQQKIVEEVLKQRHVKPITIILNLKNNPQFIRTGRRQYALKEINN